MSNILRDKIEKIKLNLNPYVWEYLGNFIDKKLIPKKKEGDVVKLLCLNHHGKGPGKDNNPDMMFYKSSGEFHCFSCGAHLNIFELANQFENKPITGKKFYTDNVLYLANRYGVSTEGLEEEEIGNEQIKHVTFYNITKDVSAYITKDVNEKYLARRNFTKNAARVFGLGSVKDPSKLDEYLRKKYNIEDLIELDIFSEKTRELNGNMFNKNKLIATIRDTNGNPVGFSSREMVFTIEICKKMLIKYGVEENLLTSIKKAEDLLPLTTGKNIDANHIGAIKRASKTSKYINSKASEIFRKSEILFGYSENKNKLLPHKPLNVVEGYLDVISAYQRGMHNVVAIGSAKFTDDQFEFLEKNTKVNSVTLMLDNDKAGAHGTLVATEMIVEKMNEGELLVNNYLIAKYTDKAFKDLDENIQCYENEEEWYEDISLFSYYLDVKFEEEGIEPQDILEKIVKIAAQEEAPIKRAIMIKEAYDIFYAKSIEKGEEPVFRYDDIRSQVEYFRNKTDQQARKIIENELKSFRKNLSTIKLEEVESLMDRLVESVTEKTRELNVSKKSIFDEYIDGIEVDEDDKFNKTRLGIDFGFEIFNDLEWAGGELVIIAAKSHIGKTAKLTSVTKNLIANNDNTAILYISTDDNRKKIINSIAAQFSGLDKSLINEPRFHKKMGLESDNKEKLEINRHYHKTMNFVKTLGREKRLTVLQTADGYDSYDKMYAAVKEFSNAKELKDMRKFLIVDSANKITVRGKEEERSRIEFISENLKKIGQNLDLTVFANFEPNKIGERTRMTRSKIKGSSRMELDADVIITLSQPLHELDKKTKTYWMKDNSDIPLPVIVSNLEKSKIGGKKGYVFFNKLDGMTSVVSEVDDDDEKRKFIASWFEDTDADNKLGYISE